jgi:hypothetical protein
MTWRWNNAVDNYVPINRLLPQVQNTLWIYTKNILNSRLLILSKMARLRHRRGDVGRPPSDASFALSCRLRITQRIKDLHVTKQKTVLTVWHCLWEAIDHFLRKINLEWWLRDQTILISKIMAMTGWIRLLPRIVHHPWQISADLQ